MRNYRLVYKEKIIILTTMQDYEDRSCSVQEGPRQNMNNVTQDALNPLHQCFWVSCAAIPAVGISKISSPFLCSQGSRRQLLQEVLQFSFHYLGCGVASTSVLVAFNSSLTEIKLLFILPKSCTGLSRTDLREVLYALYLYSSLIFLDGAQADMAFFPNMENWKLAIRLAACFLRLIFFSQTYLQPVSFSWLT